MRGSNYFFQKQYAVSFSHLKTTARGPVTFDDASFVVTWRSKGEQNRKEVHLTEFELSKLHTRMERMVSKRVDELSPKSAQIQSALERFERLKNLRQDEPMQQLVGRLAGKETLERYLELECG